MITSLPVSVQSHYPQTAKIITQKPVVTRIESPSFSTQKALESYLDKPCSNDDRISMVLQRVDVYV